MKKLLALVLPVLIICTSGIAQKDALKGYIPSKSPCTTLLGEIIFAPVDTTPGRQVADNYKTWENGEEILVKFLHGYGSEALRQKIMQYAREWENYGNIKLKFVPDYTPVTNIRIRLGSKFDSLGHNSLVGVDCNRVAQSLQTMNLDTSDFLDYDHYAEEFKSNGPFYRYLVNKGANVSNYTYAQLYNDVIFYPVQNKRYVEDFLRGTTQHEFGHALGLLHEQSFPGAIRWNKDTVYKYYARFGWNKDRVDFNVLEMSEQFFTNGSTYDPKSIMHYAVHSWQTLDGSSVTESNRISEGDKKIIAALYPKDQKVSSLAVPKVIITKFSSLDVINDENRKTIIIRPVFDLSTGAKLANAFFVARLTTEDGRHYIPTDKSLYNWNGYAGTYLKMNLFPNSKISYNNGANKLELLFPYNQVPDLKGKKFRIEFTIYQDDVATGKLDRLVIYSYSLPMSITR